MKKKNESLYLVYSLNSSTSESDSVNISMGKPVYFSDKENAEDIIKRFKEVYDFYYDNQMSNLRVYCIILEEYELNAPYPYQLSTSIYSPEGHFLFDSPVPDDGPFCGRPENTIVHKIGDIIECPYGDKLVFGIVIGQPLSSDTRADIYGLTASDDSYAIIQQSCNEVDYAFAPLVFKPTREVPDTVRKDLEQAFAQICIE